VTRRGFDAADLRAIAIGGIAGAALRWWITDVGPVDDGWFSYDSATGMTSSETPGVIQWRMIIVNLVGTAILGAVLTWRRTASANRRRWLAIGTGFCGSLTTFSALAVEIARLLSSRPFPERFTTGTNMSGFEPADGAVLVRYEGMQPSTAVAVYLAVSLIGGVLAFVAGRFFAKATSP